MRLRKSCCLLRNIINKKLDKDQIIRIHEDWWGCCRSCRHWGGTDNDGSDAIGNHPRWNPGPCNNSKSELYLQETWTEGYCPQWDSFDIETALEMMQESENNKNNPYGR